MTQSGMKDKKKGDSIKAYASLWNNISIFDRFHSLYNLTILWYLIVMMKIKKMSMRVTLKMVILI